MREIQLVNQINDQSCVHACISMVTGKPIEEYWERYPKALSADEELILLIESKIFPVPVHLHTLNYMPFYGCYFITVPSLNCQGLNHRLLVQATTQDDWIFYDPQTGREGKQWYSKDGFSPFDEIPDEGKLIKGYGGVSFLNFEVLRDLRI